MEDIGIPVYWKESSRNFAFLVNFVYVHLYFSINVTNNPGKPGSLLVHHMQTEPKIFNPGVNIYEGSVPPFAKG